MHLFYTPDIEGDIYTLNADESRHCVRVLRLGAGEAVSLVDGKGTWYEGVIERAEVRGCEAGLRIGGNYTAGAIFTAFGCGSDEEYRPHRMDAGKMYRDGDR